MSEIKIKNFGPIKSGFQDNNGFLDIRKLTVFIGNQGTGKSCVTKLISTFSWLEKSLYLENLEETYIKNYNRFVKKYCGYHNLKNYFLADTEIQYKGTVYDFYFQDNNLTISKKEPTLFDEVKKYLVPKIMYIPAERNFLSAVENPRKPRIFSPSLSTCGEEFERSIQELSEPLKLPIGSVYFVIYNGQPYIIGKDYRLKLSEASSGFQSFVPLFLISRNLALWIHENQEYFQNQTTSLEERKILQEQLKKILFDDSIPEELKEDALKLLSSKYRPECFINIVEEPEQNLFPKSQKDGFYKLLEFANLREGNKLILTTHSPYIINDLTLAIKAYEVLQKIRSSGNQKADLLKQKLTEIVPEASCIYEENAIVYELTEEGGIKRLPTYHGLPSDENYLNISLAETNELFDNLLEIEEELCA